MTQQHEDFQATAPWYVTEQAIGQVQRWIQTAQNLKPDPSAVLLSQVLQDPNGLAFTMGFVDRVIRPEDPHVAAQALAQLGDQIPTLLPWPLKTVIRTASTIAKSAPRVVVPLAQRALKNMVGHLILDASPQKLGRAIQHLRADGTKLNINVLGEAILGHQEAQKRIQTILALIDRHDVDYVSIKVSATVAPQNHWAHDQAVENILTALRPIYRAAMNADPETFINLDMEEYQDLDLTLDVFQRLMSAPEFLNYRAGIVLQAYLPEAYQALLELQKFAAGRIARGGAPIKVRIVKGANLPMEKVQAAMHGWPQTVWPTKQDTDTHYKRMLHYALRPRHLDNVHIGVAGQNLFDIALAYTLMQHRGIPVAGPVDFEMLLGMASTYAQAVQADVGKLLLYTPVVHPEEFDVAISYLVRRLEEAASTENFIPASFNLHIPEVFEDQADRFRAAVNQLENSPDHIPKPRRRQNRFTETYGEPATTGFTNVADTDPNLSQNRQWADRIFQQISGSTLGMELVTQCLVETPEALEPLIQRTIAAGKIWQQQPLSSRRTVLNRLGNQLAGARAELIEVMGAETGKTLDQADPEISEGIDFAHYYGQQCLTLDQIPGATAQPVSLTVVTPPWNFPVAIPTGSITAALAAGSPVIFKPAPQAQRTGAVLAKNLWQVLKEFDLPQDLVQLVIGQEDTIGSALVADPRVERVILTGGYATAQHFRSMRDDIPLLGETSGKNAMIITPSADYDRAVADVVASAFGHAGQKCSAASLLILVGSTAFSHRFRRQLLDAVQSLVVGHPQQPATQMGPVIEPPGNTLMAGLTVLENGQRWQLRPESLDDTGRLYSPGIRSGVTAGSAFHHTEYFGPILGIMTAKTLEDAINYVNQIPYGLTSGIHSLDPTEIHVWSEQIAAGNLYVNRGITGAIVQRQPFGGWKRSSIGPGAKVGGPNYLITLTDWVDNPNTLSAIEPVRTPPWLTPVTDLLDAADTHWLARAINQDEFTVDVYTGQRDISQVAVELNLLRYRPVPVLIRVGHSNSAALAQALRSCWAGIRVQQAVATGLGTGVLPTNTLSLPVDTAPEIGQIFDGTNVHVVYEDSTAWLRRVAHATRLEATQGTYRIRMIDRTELAQTMKVAAHSPETGIYHQPVTSAGRLEMLPFIREQAVTMTAHRFGALHQLPYQALGDIQFG